MTLAPDGQTPTALRCYRHPDRETYVTCTRCGRPICPACMRPAAVGFHCPEEAGATSRPVRTALGGRPTDGRPVLTLGLIALNVLIYLAASTSGGVSGSPDSKLFAELVLYAPNVAVSHQYYRLVTSMFLHLNLIHIALNMYCLYLIGPPLERILGRSRYLALYLVSGLAGSALAYAIGPTFIPEAGASGAIFGLFGAFALVARRLRLDIRPIMVTIVINLVLSFSISGISWQAHIGGLVAGAALGAGLAYAPPRLRLPAQAASFAGIALIVVVMVVLRSHSLTDHPGLVYGVLPGL